MNYHDDSIRRLDFSPDGNMIYTVSSDQSIGIMTAGVLQGKITKAHDVPINSVVHIENGNIIATGDDDGLIRIWDLRIAAEGNLHKSMVMELDEHDGTV